MRSEGIGHGAQTTGLDCLADNLAGVVREGAVEVGVWGVKGEQVCVCVCVCVSYIGGSCPQPNRLWVQSPHVQYHVRIVCTYSVTNSSDIDLMEFQDLAATRLHYTLQSPQSLSLVFSLT